MKKLLFTAFLLPLLIFTGCESIPDGADVRISTDFGNIYIDLYDDTPQHKENFLRLASEGFYDGTTFHRVMKGFMVQGGDPGTKDGANGGGDLGYKIPREIRSHHWHKRGAVAAARMPDQVNPQWESSSSQFFIVHGRKFDDNLLDNISAQIPALIEAHSQYVFESNPRNNWVQTVDLAQLSQDDPDSFQVVKAKIDRGFKAVRDQFPQYRLTDEMRDYYKNTGGAPMLDGMYTVFGQVVGGMDVVDQIAAIKVEGEMAAEIVRMDIDVLD